MVWNKYIDGKATAREQEVLDTYVLPSYAYNRQTTGSQCYHSHDCVYMRVPSLVTRRRVSDLQ